MVNVDGAGEICMSSESLCESAICISNAVRRGVRGGSALSAG